MLRRTLLVLVAATAAVVTTATPASAHVTVQPGEAEAGGFTKLTFRTPNERDDAGTVKLEVFFPEDQPLANASVRPLEGWEATVERTDEGVSKITWEGGTIEPGQFQEFEVSVGPLPSDEGTMVLPAIQTYSSGEVVRWIEEPVEGGAEPESPAPVLRLVAAEEDDLVATDDGDDDGTDPLAVAALVVAVIGAGLGAVALRQAVRRSGTS